MNITKLKFSAAVAATILLAGAAQGQSLTNSFSTAVLNAPIPDGNPSGQASQLNISGVTGPITGLSVALNITGGFNGDLYAYLAGPGGGMAVLLNRPGLSSSNSFGYGNAGFNITLSDGSPNVHFYQIDPSFSNPGSGQVTGVWAPDGRNIDPQTDGTTLAATGSTADLSAFNGGAANGAWTLFVADMSSGGQATLVSWGLTVVTVPEPQTWLLVAGGVGVLFALNRRRKL